MSALLDVTRTYRNFVGMIEPFEFEIVDGDGQSIEWAAFYVAPELIKACRATRKVSALLVQSEQEPGVIASLGCHLEVLGKA
eukprot:9608183-Prorocentrum_lima.AAC.1